jgi:hypothetical protein
MASEDFQMVLDGISNDSNKFFSTRFAPLFEGYGGQALEQDRKVIGSAAAMGYVFQQFEQILGPLPQARMGQPA